MHTCTRRTFIVNATVAALSLVGIAASPAAAEETAMRTDTSWEGYTPGTYSCEVIGHNAPFTVTCTFTSQALSAIDTSNNNETLGVGKVALEQISNDVVRTQSLNVDGVSGASVTSAALLSAIENCAQQAGGARQLLAKPGPTDNANDSFDADVCVIGAGGSGLCAAVAAAQTGASVVVLEKIGIDGGSTNVSEGALNAVDPDR